MIIKDDLHRAIFLLAGTVASLLVIYFLTR